MKKSDGLLHELAVHLIPHIGDAGKADVLDQVAAKKFRSAFDEKQKKKRNREYAPHIVDSMRNERIQKNRVRGSRNLKKDQLLRGGLRVQDDVKRGPRAKRR